MTPPPDTAEVSVYSPIAGNGAIPTAPSSRDEGASERVQADIPSFIETQFPVSRLSKESYKERDAKNSQTLTPLGKWWGRKPLIMVRAVILGLLMPASNDPRKDRDVFLALLTMDEEGLWKRKSRNIPLKEIYRLLTPQERSLWFAPDTDPGRPKFKQGTKAVAKQRLQRIVFDKLSYDEKLKWCDRPEYLDGPSDGAWDAINDHLSTSARKLPELVRELGKRRFGRVPRVGDAFCGGGSVPFEAARIGCEAYGSDLNPVAGLLTWGALNIVGGGEEVAKDVKQAQAQVFTAVDQQISDWRLEHNGAGWRADTFLYCTETTCPECGWEVPLAGTWIVGEKPPSVARLVPHPKTKRFDIEIISDVDEEALEIAQEAATVKDNRLRCPNADCERSTSMTAIRGDQQRRDGRGQGLRLWENDDLTPRRDDTFQERIYCIRWRLPQLDTLLWGEQSERQGGGIGDHDKESSPIPDWVELEEAIQALATQLSAKERHELQALRARSWEEENSAFEEAQQEFEALKSRGHSRKELAAARERVTQKKKTIVQRNERIKALAKSIPSSVYQTVNEEDLAREARALTLLRERFQEWQTLGYIPNRAITPGYNTNQILRERAWTHWHHLFTPRQSLTLGLFSSKIDSLLSSKEERVASALGLSRCADYNSKMCRWHTRTVGDKSEQTFSNQALNTMLNFAGRGLQALEKAFYMEVRPYKTGGHAKSTINDARGIDVLQDVWLTDPPYADAVNYHELSEYLLAWQSPTLKAVFPEWYIDSKRALAVQGFGAKFRRDMVECYRNLADYMPSNGFQVVMFTHQNASVWADLTLILWAAGLRVTAAWTIATETQSALKKGNYVQGTVLMVLRKQTSEEAVFLDEVVPVVEVEVERQLKSMLELDDREDPNFSDADYQLAAYAAALRVLTRYGSIEDIDIAYELERERSAGESNPIESIIEDAVRTASNFLVPEGIPNHLWRRLGPEEKLYLKGLEVESHGDYRAGVYQEFARGFGVRDYRFMLRTGKANETRLKTASEFQRRELGETVFGQSLVRHALYAVWRAAETGDVAGSLTWLRSELPDYWPQREALANVLRYLERTEIDHWRDDAEAARIVAGAVENDHV